MTELPLLFDPTDPAVALDPSAWMPWNYTQALAAAKASVAQATEAPLD